MNASGQLGAGAVMAASTYANGRFSIYVHGYSADQAVAAGQGLFVYSTQRGSWSPAGTTYGTGQVVALQPGWNLAAAPFPVVGITASAVNSEASSCGVKEVATYSSGAYSTWVPGEIGDLTIPFTSGLWIECAQAGSWTPS
jgi:hypothetical protein